MVTTIQINEQTLELLKKIKGEVQAKSYEEAIKKMIIDRTKKKSMAGSLARYYKDTSLKKILKELQDERRKSDRF